MDERKRSPWPWIVGSIVLLPVLYVAGSGPTRPVAVYSETIVLSIMQAGPGPSKPLTQKFPKMRRWWTRLYWPVIWTADKPWGKPIRWYWGHFPPGNDVR